MKNILAIVGGLCVAKTIYKIGEIAGEIKTVRREVSEIRRERKEEYKKVWASA